MADRQVRHLKAIDGPSSGFTHRVSSEDQSGKIVHNNHWNNFLFGRNALDFINDKKAVEAGLGYEECSGIMLHNPDAYDENGLCRKPDDLRKVIDKYLFLSEQELDYKGIKCRFIA